MLSSCIKFNSRTRLSKSWHLATLSQSIHIDSIKKYGKSINIAPTFYTSLAVCLLHHHHYSNPFTKYIGWGSYSKDVKILNVSLWFTCVSVFKNSNSSIHIDRITSYNLFSFSKQLLLYTQLHTRLQYTLKSTTNKNKTRYML